jgi:hypothetical protein
MEEAKNEGLPNNKEGILASVTDSINKTIDTVTNATAATFTPSEPVNKVEVASNTIANTTAESIENVKTAITNILNVNENIFYLIILALIIAVIAGYTLYYIITDNVLYQQKVEVSGTEVPIICNELSYFKIDKMLPNSNGIKRTYSFWIYINDINQYSGSYRHIAHIGTQHKQIKNSSPYIFLDSTSNKIHVRFSPKEEDPFPLSMALNDVLKNNLSDLLNFKSGDSINKCGITIDYVPIQRWVHVAIVISDVNKGFIYTYIDGELADVEKAQENKLNLYELNFENMGNLYVGGSVSNTDVNTTGFSGLISKFTLYNYDLNKNDIYKEYNKGPLNGLLASIGIPNYGLRNPVYKLNNIY